MIDKIYRLNNNLLYQVTDIVNSSENSEKKVVIYREAFGNHLSFAKDYDAFLKEATEYKRDYKHEGLKAFFALKFYDGDVSRKLVDDITDALAKLNIHTFVAVRDIEKYGETQGLDMEHFMPKYTFPEMETSDIMVIEYSESGAGLGMGADHCYCHGVPVYLIAKTGSKISTTVNSVATKVIFYDTMDDITNAFKELIDSGNLITNSKTCNLK